MAIVSTLRRVWRGAAAESAVFLISGKSFHMLTCAMEKGVIDNYTEVVVFEVKQTGENENVKKFLDQKYSKDKEYFEGYFERSV